MPVNVEAYQQLKKELDQKEAVLVAVSKTKTAEEILELYKLGHRDFGENYVQELAAKQKLLPDDIRWHFIGHLQRNKVKQIAPFIQLVQSVDSLNLILEINKQGEKCKRVIPCLLQVHIAREETKFGLDEQELAEILHQCSALQLKNVQVNGLMGMASLTGDMQTVRNEFKYLHRLFLAYQTSNIKLETLSMGMSSDYPVALEEGSNMVRIGTILFGSRN